MKRTTIDFGIDLGTTNSTIAVIDEIDAKVIPNKGGSGTTASAVWIDKRGNIHVGQEAKLRALGEDPDNADVEFKLRMGLGAEGKKVFVRSGREMSPEELSAEVVKSLKIDAQANLGEEVLSAVITVPSAFEYSQTNATQKAAQLAGFVRSPLLLEPVAASLAYGFQSESDKAYWLVYDFGGGTFDSAVMRIRDGLIQVVNHDGDNFLGGKLIDWDIIIKKLIPALTCEFNLPDFRRGNLRWKNALGKLKYHAEQAKIEVCRTKASCDIWVEGLCEDNNGKEVDFAYTLTPEDIEEVSKPYIEKSLALCRRTLEDCNLKGSDMERILMVGGTTLNPWVRDAVQAELGSQVEFGIDPVTVVARGAAIFASTQAAPQDNSVVLPKGTWKIQVEHTPVGNVSDPDIGGRIIPPNGQNVKGFTVELIDKKTQWRSGRITLGEEGVFMTQLFAEKQRRHEYTIELHDNTGTRIPTSPDTVCYTLGIVPEDPPAPMTIGIGLANGSVATYIKKGTKLPFRKSMDHYTTIPLRADNANDELRIPLLEGEHTQARRNHGIGSMVIKGSDIRRDLPVGSQIEITLSQDASLGIRLHAYVNALDEEFETTFDTQMKHESIDVLREEVQRQKERLATVGKKADEVNAPQAKAALTRVEDQKLVEQVDTLLEAAETDADGRAELDRRVRELATYADEVEDAVEWPELLEEAKATLKQAEEILSNYGQSTERRQYASLKEETQRAIDVGDPAMLRRSIDELHSLNYRILERQDSFHIMKFNWLVERLQSMQDPGMAEQIISQGRRAINNNDIEALKAANRQLINLLPTSMQAEAAGFNDGHTMTHG